jgi:ABC-2 type transport system permease protein
MDLSIIKRILRFKITIQTFKDNLKATIIFSLLFAAMAAMYSSFYPQFKDLLAEMAEDPQFIDFLVGFTGESGDFVSYVGFLNLELYSIFFVLILAIVVAFIASTIISKEIESKTIDLLISNPVSRTQIIIERFIGLIPMILIINFVTMFVVYGITIAINESIDFVNLLIAHLYAVPYFLAVIAIALLISTIIDEKMKSSIFMIALIIGMFFMEYISHFAIDAGNIGLVSLTHYYKPYDALKSGTVDFNGVIVLSSVTIISLIISVIYFDRKDIKV